MPSCECCWADSWCHEPDSYYRAMKEHEDRRCVCTQKTLEGRKARAGQFWDEETQTDTRDREAAGRVDG